MPIPHLSNVCWFKMTEEFIVPPGKYAFFLRIAGDYNFELRNSHFILDYGKLENQVAKDKNVIEKESISQKDEETTENIGKQEEEKKNEESKSVLEGENILRVPFPKNVENQCKKNVEKFIMWEMGKIELKGDKNVKVLFRTEHKDDWWKYGWWLDCFVFNPINEN